MRNEITYILGVELFISCPVLRRMFNILPSMVCGSVVRAERKEIESYVKEGR